MNGERVGSRGLLRPETFKRFLEICGAKHFRRKFTKNKRVFRVIDHMYVDFKKDTLNTKKTGGATDHPVAAAQIHSQPAGRPVSPNLKLGRSIMSVYVAPSIPASKPFAYILTIFNQQVCLFLSLLSLSFVSTHTRISIGIYLFFFS